MRAWWRTHTWAERREAASIIAPVFLAPWRNRPIKPNR